MSRYNQQKLELAQRMAFHCRLCGGPIQMFCCGETFPLSVAERLKLDMEYGLVWCGDEVTLSREMVAACQELLNVMNREGILAAKINADGYVETER
jgi:hypothetical protein